MAACHNHKFLSVFLAWTWASYHNGFSRVATIRQLGPQIRTVLLIWGDLGSSFVVLLSPNQACYALLCFMEFQFKISGKSSILLEMRQRWTWEQQEAHFPTGMQRKEVFP